MNGHARSSRAAMAGAIVAFFAFRLLYGLSSDLFFEDETQIYLMGLRYYATGAWPHFGPDVVWTKSEIPGALQSLLIGLPFKLAPYPEAPYVLLNLLSLAALAAFAWYITVHLPQLPRWLVWSWLMTLPWTINFSTHIINPSYILAPAIAFFIGFFEVIPAFSRKKLPEPLAFLLMGAAISWIMQIHMSWPLLVPFAALAWALARRRGPIGMLGNAAALLVGWLIFATVLMPTFVTYGLHAGSGNTLRNLHIRPASPSIALSTLARFFSFASLEIWRFIAADDGVKTMVLLRHLWIVPVALVVWFAGIWQPLWMLREWFQPRSPLPEWRPLKWLVAGTIGFIYLSYWFVLEPAQAHAFYLTAPVAFLFAAYCWTFVDSPRWRTIAAVLIASNVVFHLWQASVWIPERSVYRNREAVAAAIRRKEPEMFAHRRAFAVEPGPLRLNDPSRPWEPHRDITLTNENLRMGPRHIAVWTFSVRNGNEKVAYRDVMYRTHYRDTNGVEVDVRYGFLKDIMQPGTTVAAEVIDGIISAPFTTATIELLGAEALVPIR